MSDHLRRISVYIVRTNESRHQIINQWPATYEVATLLSIFIILTSLKIVTTRRAPAKSELYMAKSEQCEITRLVTENWKLKLCSGIWQWKQPYSTSWKHSTKIRAILLNTPVELIFPFSVPLTCLGNNAVGSPFCPEKCSDKAAGTRARQPRTRSQAFVLYSRFIFFARCQESIQTAAPVVTRIWQFLAHNISLPEETQQRLHDIKNQLAQECFFFCFSNWLAV